MSTYRESHLLDRPIEAADFSTGNGAPYYGIHMFSHEDDWGWTAYGHHEPRRLIAAIVADCRYFNIREELRETVTVSSLQAAIKQLWATNFRIWDDGFVQFDWCEAETPGAVPLTRVIP